jgi:hypothetical protein
LKSERFNRKGETIPSVSSAYNYSHGGYGGYTGPVQRTNLACAYGCDDPTDGGEYSSYDDWNSQIERQRKLREEREERQHNATVLSRETSLGSRNTTHAIFKQAQTQHDLNLFLIQNNRFAIGDKVTYAAISPDSQDLNLSSIGIVLAVEREIEKVNWPRAEDVPQPFLVLSFSPFDWAQKHENWGGPKFQARWDSMRYRRHLTTNENIKFCKDNVQLSDYIRQAKDALKAGLVEIQGRT